MVEVTDDDGDERKGQTGVSLSDTRPHPPTQPPTQPPTHSNLHPPGPSLAPADPPVPGPARLPGCSLTAGSGSRPCRSAQRPRACTTRPSPASSDSRRSPHVAAASGFRNTRPLASAAQSAPAEPFRTPAPPNQRPRGALAPPPSSPPGRSAFKPGALTAAQDASFRAGGGT